MAYKIKNKPKKVNIRKATNEIMDYFKINGVPVSSVDRKNITEILKESKE